MRGMRCIANEDNVLVKPLLAQDAIELEPHGRAAQVCGIGDQRISFEPGSEEFFTKAIASGCSILSRPAAASSFPGSQR